MHLHALSLSFTENQLPPRSGQSDREAVLGKERHPFRLLLLQILQGRKDPAPDTPAEILRAEGDRQDRRKILRQRAQRSGAVQTRQYDHPGAPASEKTEKKGIQSK